MSWVGLNASTLTVTAVQWDCSVELTVVSIHHAHAFMYDAYAFRFMPPLDGLLTVCNWKL